MRTYSAIDVAAWFLERAATDEAAVRDISNMKLQKLVFFSQLVSVMTFGEDSPIHGNNTHAWDYGPVVPRLYKLLKPFGGNPLSFADANVKAAFDKCAPQPIEDADALSVLTAVWNKFKSWTAIQLSALTHREDSPWAVTYAAKPYEVITPAVMRKHGFGKA